MLTHLSSTESNPIIGVIHSSPPPSGDPSPPLDPGDREINSTGMINSGAKRCQCQGQAYTPSSSLSLKLSWGPWRGIWELRRWTEVGRRRPIEGGEGDNNREGLEYPSHRWTRTGESRTDQLPSRIRRTSSPGKEGLLGVWGVRRPIW